MVIFFFRLKKSSPRKEVPEDTVLIYGVGRGVSAPSASPFPLKLETFCRMADIPYMVIKVFVSRVKQCERSGIVCAHQKVTASSEYVFIYLFLKCVFLVRSYPVHWADF